MSEGKYNATPQTLSDGGRMELQVDANGNLKTVAGAAGTLPTGAATAAKQPALGTAGTASSDVITVQGIAGGVAVMVGGAVASGATDSGNPVKAAGVYNSTLPTFTNGQRGDIQIGSRGAQAVTIFAADATTSVALGNTNSDSLAVSGTSSFLRVASMNLNTDGTSLIRARGDTSGTVIQPYALTASRWGYAAAASGISNTTTAVTIAASAGGSLRNYVTNIQIFASALGAATEIALRDGAGGAVLWRGFIGTAGLPNGLSIDFSVPLKGTAATLMEVVTLTASITGSVYFNAQGFSAL